MRAGAAKFKGRRKSAAVHQSLEAQGVGGEVNSTCYRWGSRHRKQGGSAWSSCIRANIPGVGGSGVAGQFDFCGGLSPTRTMYPPDFSSARSVSSPRFSASLSMSLKDLKP